MKPVWTLLSINITVITRHLLVFIILLVFGVYLSVFLRMASFFPRNSMSNDIYVCYQLWIDSLDSHQKQ